MVEATKEEKKELTVVQKKALLKEGAKRFVEVVNDLIDRKANMERTDLQLKYDIGKVAIIMTDERTEAFHHKTYGQHVVRDVADALGETEPEISVMQRFARVYTQKQLEHLTKKKWPWRAIRALVQIEDVDVRKKFEEAFEKGKYKNSDALGRSISDYRDKQKKKTGASKGRGATGLIQPIRSSITHLTKLNSEAFPSLIKKLKAASEEDSERITDSVVERVPELREQIELSKQFIVDAEKGLKAAGL